MSQPKTDNAPPTARAEPAIRVEGLSKRFRIGFRRRVVTALRDATFEVPSGCVFGLVGPNGAGKTTTIKILMGLLRPSTGRAEICGEPVPSVASRRQVGYLPEHPHFYDHLRPSEYLVYVGRLYGLSRAKGVRRARELLDLVGLGDELKKPIRKFSKGMVQRLGIAQSMIHDPEVVILDEPQSGLDPLGRREVKDLIADLGRRGRTVFFSSHILPDVEDVCDEVAVMIQGRIRDIGRVDALLSPRVVATEVEVSGLSGELERELVDRASHVNRLERSVLLTFSADVDTEAILRELVRGGAVVHRVVPHREGLEELFVREARSGSGEGS